MGQNHPEEVRAYDPPQYFKAYFADGSSLMLEQDERHLHFFYKLLTKYSPQLGFLVETS